MSSSEQATELQPFSILVVEDNPGDVRLVQEFVRDHPDAAERLHALRAEDDAPPAEEAPPVDAGPDEAEMDLATLEFEHADTLSAGCEVLEADAIDVVLLDLNLPDSTGLETLQAILATDETVPVIVLTGIPEDRLGKEAVSAGAQDYLPKDRVTGEVLIRTIEYAVERKDVERTLRQQTNQLSVLNQLMRHDIRNDISLVVGRANELAEHVEPRGQAALEEILTAGNHILQLTRSIDESAETVTSDDDVPLAPIDIGAVLEEEVSKARALYTNADVSLAGDPPAIDVQANRLLSSVFGNLISNALLYNDADTPTVTIDASVDPEQVTVTVADNGRGIPIERQDDLFDQGTSGADGGTGTGLYLVDQLVSRFGGDVRAEDAADGTAFIVELSRA